MNILWQQKLKKLEQEKKWDEAISFMEDVISKEPDSVDAYLSLQYLIMNLLVEERDYDGANSDHYVAILQKHFHEAYAKFSENPAYLYYTGRIAVMSEWYFDLEYDDVCMMIDKAGKLDPDNKIYQWNYYSDLNPWNFQERELLRSYIKVFFDSYSEVRFELDSKGAVGDYILDMMLSWSKRVSLHIRCIDKKKLDWSRALRAINFFVLRCIDNSDFKIGVQLKNDPESPLHRTLSTMTMWKDIFKIDQLKNYRECYEIMMDIIKKYALQHSLDNSLMENMQLVPGKEETICPWYWNLWIKCIDDALKKK